MLVSKNAKICVTPNAKPKSCVIPNANPQCESVEYRLHWVSHWACTFHVICVKLYLHWVANTKAVSLEYGLYIIVEVGDYRLLQGPT